MAKHTDLLQVLLDDTVQKYLDIPDIENININKEGEVFIEVAGKPKECVKDKNLTIRKLKDLADTIATTNGLVYKSSYQPLSSKLKDGTRVQVNQMPCIASGVTFSFRKRAVNKFSISDFGLTKKQVTLLENAVKDRKNIIVCGGTGSGKTTFLECLVKHIEPTRRVISVEDPQEIIFDHIEDIVSFSITEVESHARAMELSYIKADCLRKTPDSIIVGEIREAIMAEGFLELINTGHEGSMSTVHANNTSAAIDALINKIIKLTDGKGEEAIRRELQNALDYVVFIGRDKDGNRRAVIEQF
jgi:pilus assembly protein CpaF